MALEIPPLPNGQPIVDSNGLPTLAFTVYWQRLIDLLENQEGAQQEVLDSLSAQLDLINEGQIETARATSYTAPTNVLTAADVGATATITIAAHTRIYPGPIADLAVSGGSIAGLPFSTQYYVYYDDVTLEDATPTYVATTNVATAQVGAADGRHFVGAVSTPADGGAPSGGTGGSPPGGGGGNPIP